MSDNKDNDMPQDKSSQADDTSTNPADAAETKVSEPAAEAEATTAPADEPAETVEVLPADQTRDAAAAPVPPAPPAPPAPPQARSGGGFPVIGTLALLLVIGLAFATGWAVMEGQRREAMLLDRIDDMEKLTDRKVMDADSQRAQITQYGDSLKSGLEGELRRGLASFEPRLESQTDRMNDLKQSLDAIKSQATANAGELGSFKQELTGYNEELAKFRSSDQEDWLIAEVEYLLRLANQRVIMAGDAQAAEALLTNADNIVKQMNDVRMHDVRKALANDLAALRAVPRLDTEGIYLRLSGLSDQAAKLALFKMPDTSKDAEEDVTESWRSRLSEGYQAAVDKVSEYVVVRRRDVPMEAMIDPQWEGLVRQNLRMLFEQAQVALLSGNAKLYRQSLERASHWVKEFFESDEQAAQAMESEISGLIDETVTVDLPDITASLVALDAARKAREQSEADSGPGGY